MVTGERRVYCPHCGYAGTDKEVDEHRTTGVHNDEPQMGSNLAEPPRLPRKSR